MRNPGRETTFRFKQFSVVNCRSAMKVGTDGVLLGAWATIPPGEPLNDERFSILDVGAGTGLISLMLAQRYPSAAITGIEIDDISAEECSLNFIHSPWSNRLSLRQADFLQDDFDGSFNLIVSNPPFFNNGAKAPDTARNTARHEDSLPLGKLIERSASLLEPGNGSLALILPADRSAEAEFAAEVAKLSLWRKVSLTTVPGKAPRRVLLQFCNLGKDDKDPGKQPIVPEISTQCLSDRDGRRSQWHQNLVKDFYLNP